jgi:S1-C subfamily serine protease
MATSTDTPGFSMTDSTAFVTLSHAIAATARQGAPAVAGLEWGGRHHISGVLWRPGVLVTSEQSLPQSDGCTAILPGGAQAPVSLAGRDPSTNVAVLRLEADAPTHAPAEAGGVGELVLALGSDGGGDITARMGGIEVLGPAWESQRGGRIDRLIRLGVRLGPAAEGGPVLSAEGGLLGMSTFAPGRGVLVIPAATISRVLEQLLNDGRITRGWLGVGLHPVALPREIAEREGVGGGLMVVNLAEGGPAAASLLPGDILLELEGAVVTTPRSVAAALGPDTIGRALALKVLRGGAVTTQNVTIAVRPS